MGMPPLFKFELLDISGNYYYADDEGVHTTNTETALKNSPSNWQEILIKFGRDESKYGVFRAITAPLQFCLDGLEILRFIYYKDNKVNFEAYCKVVIKRRNDGEIAPWSYDKLAEFTVDFANEVDDGVNETGDFISVRLVSSGLNEIIDDKYDTPFEIPLDDPDAVTIQMDGVEQQADYNWLTGDSGGAAPYVQVATTASAGGQGYVFPMAISTQEGNEINDDVIYIQNQSHEVFLLNNAPQDANKFLNCDVSFIANYEVSGTIDVDTGVAGTVMDVSIGTKDYANNTIGFTNLYTSPSYSGINSFSFTDSGTFSFIASTKSYFIVLRAIAGAGLGGFRVRDFHLRITFTRAVTPTTCKALRYNKFMQKLIDKITDSQYPLVSSYLSKSVNLSALSTNGYYNNLPSYTYVTCGDALRGLDNAVIKTTLGDAMQDMFSRWMLGMSLLDDKVRIEPINTFFNNDYVITTIEAITKLKRTTATEWIYSQFTAGYADQNIDKLNGRYEINSQQAYKLRIKKVNTEKNLKSPYRADVYGIERTRSSFSGKNSTNSESDNDVFLLESSNVISGGNYLLLKYTTAGQVNGVPSPTTHYNIGLSPQRFPLRHIPYFRSIFSLPDGVATSLLATQIEFKTGLKNTSAYTFIGGYYIKEDNDILTGINYDGTLAKAFFKPLIYMFEAQPEQTLIADVMLNPFGLIRFNDKGTYLSGFILDVGAKPGTKDTYNFRLLAAPDTVLQ